MTRDAYLVPFVEYRPFNTVAAAEDLLPRLSADLRLTGGQAGYTHTVSDDSGEWELVVIVTCRQSGDAAWVVALVQCDDLVRTTAGRTRTSEVHDAINRAIRAITQEARWVLPLNRDAEKAVQS